MSNNNDNLKRLKSNIPSNWKKNAEFRRKNKWLEYSSQIARRILAVIEGDEELNQVKLAKSLGVSPQQINKIVKGHENMTLETIYNLSQALGVELITFPLYKYNTQNNMELSVDTNKPVLINLQIFATALIIIPNSREQLTPIYKGNVYYQTSNNLMTNE